MRIFSDKVTEDDLITIIDSEVEKNTLVGHHINSFNNFMSTGINQIVTQLFQVEKTIQNERTKTEEDNKIAIISFLVKFNDIRTSKPSTRMQISGRSDILMPNFARKHNLNYSSPLMVDATITAKAFPKDGSEPYIRTEEVKDFQIASMPIMVGSKFCHLSEMTKEAKKMAEEDPNDLGAYFILKGGEWVISMIETRLFNHPHIFRNVGHEKEIARLEFISKPGDAYENSSELIMRYVQNGNIFLMFTSNSYLKILNIPFYVIFRLFGMTTDKEIIDNIIYGYSTPENKDVVSDHILQVMKKAFKAPDPDFGEAQFLTDQSQLLEYFSKRISILMQTSSLKEIDESVIKYLNANVLKLLDKNMFPHIGLASDSRHKKLRFLGHLIHKLLLVEMQIVPSTDRDSLKTKRINAAGRAYAKAFKTQFNLAIVQSIKKKLTKDFKAVPFSNVSLAQSFKSAIHGPDLEKALIQAIVVGSKELTVKNRQIPNRLASEILHRKNQLNVLATLNTIKIPSTSASKQDARADEMRRVHPSYIGYGCSVQSTDNEQVGLIKQKTIGASIVEATSSELLKEILLKDVEIITLEKIFPEKIHKFDLTKILVNGDWIGCCTNSPRIVQKYKEIRRGFRLTTPEKISSYNDNSYKFMGNNNNDGISVETSIHWDTEGNEINFWVDAGRMMRPLLIVRNNGELDPIGRELFGFAYDPYKDPEVGPDKKLVPGCFVQDILLTKEDIKQINKKSLNINTLRDRGLIDYVSSEEMENCYIASSLDILKENQHNPLEQFTHCEIPAALFGVPALTPPYAQHNQPPRITFQTNHVKQVCSWYSLNWPYRIDKHTFISYYCEVPLIKTLANKYIYPNGSNTIVAIDSYTGFNQEDSMVYNKSSSDRGNFKGIAFNFIKVELEKDEKFGNPDESNTIIEKKQANYSKIHGGFPKKGTILKKNDVIIGKMFELSKPVDRKTFKDSSILYPYDEEGMVETVIRARNNDDEEFAKVKFSSIRPLGIGSKCCLTPDHEVLTKNGWINIKNITTHHEIATLDIDNHVVYHYPTEIYNYEHHDLIYHIKNDQINVSMTLNHKLYVQNSDKFYLEEVQNLLDQTVNFNKVCNGIINYQNTQERNNIILLIGNFIRYFNDKTFTGILNYLVNTYNLNLENLNLENGIKILIHWFKVNCYTEDKICLPKIWQTFNKEECQLLVNTICPGNLISSDSKFLLNDMQHLCLHAGIVCSIENNNAYVFRYIQYYYPEVKLNKDNITNYNGYVYCVNVPNHIFYVRNTGNLKTAHWTGNSSRFGQKSLLSLYLNQWDMPFTSQGITATLILNPHAIPTRMTIGQIIEGITAKLAALQGSFSDATIFRKTNLELIGDKLEELGYDRYGTEVCYDGKTGEAIDKELFISPIYYQRLQKFVTEEIYSISTGPTDVLTRQPIEGKSNGGGLRIGEMENNVIISHGEGHFIMEKFRDDSDGFDIYICRTCGKRPVVNEEEDIAFCNTCQASKMDPDIVKVRSTWASKLFMDEIMSSNIGISLGASPYQYETE